MFCDDCVNKEISTKDLQSVIDTLDNFKQKVIVVADGKYEASNDGTPFNENDDIKRIILNFRNLINGKLPPPIILSFEDSVDVAGDIINLYKAKTKTISKERKEILKKIGSLIGENEGSRNWLIDMFVGLVLGGIFGGASIYLIKRKDIHDKFNNMNQELQKDREDINKGQSNINEDSKLAEFRNENNDLKNENSKLKDENNQLKGENNRLKNESNSSLIDEQSRVVELSVERKITTFYLSTPNADGSFRDTRSNTMNPANHMYEFELIDENTAKFKPIDNPSVVTEATSYPESYLKPVCEYIGGFNSSAKSIKLERGNEGIAKLVGDKWELKTKAKIKLL
ncbi:hypothetical protein D0T08_17830 [Emticicia sp. C21]|nr:hypothetical protein D0T08_17830 [Emticicia sp. C21]